MCRINKSNFPYACISVAGILSIFHVDKPVEVILRPSQRQPGAVTNGHNWSLHIYLSLFCWQIDC